MASSTNRTPKFQAPIILWANLLSKMAFLDILTDFHVIESVFSDDPYFTSVLVSDSIVISRTITKQRTPN